MFGALNVRCVCVRHIRYIECEVCVRDMVGALNARCVRDRMVRYSLDRLTSNCLYDVRSVRDMFGHR